MTITLTRATKTVALCTNLSMAAEHDHAVAALDEAKSAAVRDPRENGSTTVREAAEAVVALESEMKAHTLTVTLQALPRKAWNEFVADHSPREGDDTDKALGVNVSALDEVIAPSIVAVTAPDGSDVPFVPATDWPVLADEMSSAQWEPFALAVLSLNNGVQKAPFSPAASLAILRSEQTSKRPNDSE